MHAPLKITFNLATPMVAAAYPIHLDALVAYAKTRQTLSLLDESEVSDASIRTLAEVLPFDKVEKNGEWVWQASALMPEGQGDQSVRMWTRKTNVYDYANRAMTGTLEVGARTLNALSAGKTHVGTIDTARGLLKNHFDFYPVVAVQRMIAWCVGDIDEIESLLAPETGLVTHLGKRTRIGHGQIQSVTVEHAEEAHEKWSQRVLPWQAAEDDILVQAAFRPPYWAVENRAMAYMPAALQ